MEFARRSRCHVVWVHCAPSRFNPFFMARFPFSRSAGSQWVPPMIAVARGLVSVANCVPFPYVNAALSAGLALLELIQTVGKSDEDLKYLAESVVAIMRVLREEVDSHPTENTSFRQICEEFTRHLTQLSKDLELMSRNMSSSKLKKYLNTQNIRDEITRFTKRVNDLRANATLAAATGTRMDLADAVTAVKARISNLQRELLDQRFPQKISSTDDLKYELARFEDDFHALKLGDIHLDFCSARTANFVVYSKRRKQRNIGWTDYKAIVNGDLRTVRVYQGSDPTQSLKDFLFFLGDNSPAPHLPQLFGFCSSPRLMSLVFNGEYRTLDEYARTLPSAQAIVNWQLSLLHEFEHSFATLEAGSYLRSQPFRHFALVDAQTGKLIFSHVDQSESELSNHIGFDANEQPFLAWFVATLGQVGEKRRLLANSESDLGASIQSLATLARKISVWGQFSSLDIWEASAFGLSRGCVCHTGPSLPIVLGMLRQHPNIAGTGS
ncbi:hypothetical protein C8R47DRAFT_110143 [Mycena vitilis]|nr:hypothetical protein C8R47DRAFT_110143 [Mycena vitilis]